MNARWYNPSIGRFMTQDTYQGTLDKPLSQNLYSYVMNNPINMWDPSGNSAENDDPGAGGGSGGLPSWIGSNHSELYYENTQYNVYKNWNMYDYEKSYSYSWLIGKTPTSDGKQYRETWGKMKYETWYYSVSYDVDFLDEEMNSLERIWVRFMWRGTYQVEFEDDTLIIWNEYVSASQIASEHSQQIREETGPPPENKDAKAVYSHTSLTMNGQTSTISVLIGENIAYTGSYVYKNELEKVIEYSGVPANLNYAYKEQIANELIQSLEEAGVPINQTDAVLKEVLIDRGKNIHDLVNIIVNNATGKPVEKEEVNYLKVAASIVTGMIEGMGKSALAAIETVFSPETYEVLWEIGKAVAKSMVLGDDEDLIAIELAIGEAIVELINHEIQKMSYGNAYQIAEQVGGYIGGALLTYLSTKGAGQVLKDIKYYKGLKVILKSFDDIVNNPKSLWGKSADEVADILGEGWTRGTYGSDKTGWKFTKGDQSVFYHPGGGIHEGAYYGFSSGKLGRNKIVGSDYKPLPKDKATIIKIEE